MTKKRASNFLAMGSHSNLGSLHRQMDYSSPVVKFEVILPGMSRSQNI